MLLLKIGTGWRLCYVHHLVISTRLMSFASRCSNQLHYFLASRQKLPSTLSRWFSRELPRLLLDAENLSALITKDVPVFTYKNNRFFLLLNVFGGMQFLFWVNLALFIKSDPTITQAGKSNMSSQKNLSSWMGNFYAENLTKISVTCLSLGCLVLFFAVNYPRRTVSALTLLKGGNELGVETYSHFGRTRYFAVPLENVSCKRSRLSSPTHVAMKIRGHWMYYLLDQRDGKFHQPEVFDYVIGLSRSLK